VAEEVASHDVRVGEVGHADFLVSVGGEEDRLPPPFSVFHNTRPPPLDASVTHDLYNARLYIIRVRSFIKPSISLSNVLIIYKIQLYIMCVTRLNKTRFLYYGVVT
jgi:hypothetical protein